MKRFLFITILVLLFVTGSLYRLLSHERRDRQRLEANQRALLEDLTFYRSRNGLLVASNERLVLKKKEFENLLAEQKEVIRDLRLNLKRVESYQETSTVGRYDLDIPVIERLSPGVIAAPMPCISFADPYLTVDGCIEEERFRGRIETRDTLIQVAHRVPKKFLFISYGTKAIRQEIINKNPYSRITYATFIHLQ